MWPREFTLGTAEIHFCALFFSFLVITSTHTTTTSAHYTILQLLVLNSFVFFSAHYTILQLLAEVSGPQPRMAKISNRPLGNILYYYTLMKMDYEFYLLKLSYVEMLSVEPQSDVLSSLWRYMRWDLSSIYLVQFEIADLMLGDDDAS